MIITKNKIQSKPGIPIKLKQENSDKGTNHIFPEIQECSAGIPTLGALLRVPEAQV